MDDFGTGYSFLNLFKDLSVDVLKLDKGFMEDAANNEKEQRIVASIVQMAPDVYKRQIFRSFTRRGTGTGTT